MPDDLKPTDPKPDDFKVDDLGDLSQVPEPTDEDEERIRRKLEDDMRRKGWLPDPTPRPSSLPPQPCPKGAAAHLKVCEGRPKTKGGMGMT